MKFQYVLEGSNGDGWTISVRQEEHLTIRTPIATYRSKRAALVLLAILQRLEPFASQQSRYEDKRWRPHLDAIIDEI